MVFPTQVGMIPQNWEQVGGEDFFSLAGSRIGRLIQGLEDWADICNMTLSPDH